MSTNQQIIESKTREQLLWRTKENRQELTEEQYWSKLRDFTDQETFINPSILNSEYFQDFIYYNYCHNRTNDPNTHLYTILDIIRDYLDATWSPERQKKATTSKKLAPYFPPVRYQEARSRTFY